MHLDPADSRHQVVHLVGDVVAGHGVEVGEQGEALLLEELVQVGRLERLVPGLGSGLGSQG